MHILTHTYILCTVVKLNSLLIPFSLLCIFSGSGDTSWSQHPPSKRTSQSQSQCQSQHGGWQPPPSEWGPPPPKATSVFNSADPAYMSSYYTQHQQDQQPNPQATPQPRPSQQQRWPQGTPTVSHDITDLSSITSSGMSSLIQDLQPCESPQVVVRNTFHDGDVF